MTRFVVVPQWQGSPAARAMQLVDGAEAIAGDLPRSACVRVDVPLEAGDALGTRVHRLSTLQQTRARIDDLLASETDRIVIVGGDCSVALGGIAHAAARHERLGLVWFDAHGDLHTPDSSVSGAFAGMALRAALGDGESSLAVSPGIAPSRTVLVGARDLDVAESAFLADTPLARLDAVDLADTALADAVSRTDADAVWVHLDLDVLDPAAITGLTAASPFGADPARIVAALAALRARVPLAGASITGFAPASAAAAVDDLGTILRLVGALA
ncbi:MAG: arginase family protein [Microbacterium ginsengisoli]|jgi:arginase|nr:arginase family protein [Microbacterium ginsengisoli]